MGWQDIALVDMPTVAFGVHKRRAPTQQRSGAGDPRHCLLMRAGGVLSVLDMDQGMRPHVCMCMHSCASCSSAWQ